MPDAVTIPVGTVAFDLSSTRRVAPKYRFNTQVTLPVVDTHVIGCDEFARVRLIVVVDGKRLSVPKV